MNRESVYYITATQSFNLGDLVINRKLLELLSKKYNVYCDLYNLPSDFSESLVKDLKIINANEIFDGSLKKKHVFHQIINMKKSGIRKIFKSPGPMRADGFKSFINILLFSLLLFSLKVIGYKVYILGADLDNDNNIYDRIINQILVKSSVFITIRSYNNYNYLNQKYGSKIMEQPDFSFEIYQENKEYKKKNKVAISFRSIDNFDNHIIEYLDMVVEYFSSLNYDVIFFHQVSVDCNFNQFLFQKYSEKINVSIVKKRLWYNELTFYDDIKYVISNRLHVLLIGMEKGAIPQGLIDNNKKTRKIQDIFDGLGLNKYIYTKSLLSYKAPDYDRVNISEITNLCRIQKEKLNSIIDEL